MECLSCAVQCSVEYVFPVASLPAANTTGISLVYEAPSDLSAGESCAGPYRNNNLTLYTEFECETQDILTIYVIETDTCIVCDDV